MLAVDQGCWAAHRLIDSGRVVDDDDDDAGWTRGEAGSRLLGDTGGCKQRELTSTTSPRRRPAKKDHVHIRVTGQKQAHQDLHLGQVYHLHLQFPGLRPAGPVDWAVVVVPTSFFPTTSREPASPSPSAHCLMSSLASLHDINASSHIPSLFVCCDPRTTIAGSIPSVEAEASHEARYGFHSLSPADTLR